MINAYRILSVGQIASSDEIDEAFEKAVASVREKYSGKPVSLEASLDDLKEARRILLDENSRAVRDKKLETDGNNQNEKDQKEQILTAEQIAVELKGYTPSLNRINSTRVPSSLYCFEIP